MSRCSSPRFFKGSAGPVEDCARPEVTAPNNAAPMPAMNDRRVGLMEPVTSTLLFAAFSLCLCAFVSSCFFIGFKPRLDFRKLPATVADLFGLHPGFVQDRQQMWLCSLLFAAKLAPVCKYQNKTCADHPSNGHDDNVTISALTHSIQYFSKRVQ